MHLAQLVRRIEYWVSRGAMDIEGLGEQMVQKLTAAGLVRAPLAPDGQLARVERIEMNRRGGWTLWFDSGPRIELGNEQVPQRLVRVTLFLAMIREQAATVDVIDARYSGGVAVKVKRQALDNLEQPGESQA